MNLTINQLNNGTHISQPYHRHLLSLPILLFTITVTFGQSEGIRSFHLISVTAENILQESAINNMIQDRNGFIWLGTISGLVKFDGHEYHHYKRIGNDNTSLSDNFVRSLHLDSNQRLWIGTFDGLNLYDPVHDNFLRFLPEKTEGSITDGFINDIAEDAGGIIWLATYNGLNKFDPETQKAEVYYPVGLHDETVKDITALRFAKDTLWIGTQSNGVFFLTDNKIQPFCPAPRGYHIRDIYRDDDLLLLSTETGLVSVKGKGQVKFYYRDVSFHDIVKLKSGRILLCTHSDGLLEWNSRKSYPEVSALHVDNRTTIDRNIGVYSAMEDDSGNLWFCYDGLKKISTVSGMFRTFTPPLSGHFIRSDEVILTILPTGENEIYVTTAGGAIHRFNCFTKTFTRSLSSQNIRSHQIRGLFIDSHHRLWGFTERNELGQIHNGNFIIEKKLNEVSGNLSPLTAKSLHDHIYIGGPSGLVVGNLSKKNSYLRFREAPRKPDSLANNTVSALAIQNEDSVWVAGGSVLHLYLPKEKRFVRFGEMTGHHDFIQSIDLDTKGNVWVARNSGLACWNKKSGQLSEVGKMVPVSTNFVSILADEQDQIWIGTTSGIVRYDPATQRFHKFDSPYGAQNYYYRFSTNKTSDGHLIFGGLNGFTLFHPDDIFNDATRPEVIITRIDDGKRLEKLNKSIYQLASIDLDAGSRTLNLGFVGIYYNDPHGLTYTYYLEGVDKYWHHSGNRRYVSYSNLPV